MSVSPKIAVTLGDPNGIGPEVVIKALRDPEIRRSCEILIIGSRSVLRYYHDKGAWGNDLEVDPANGALWVRGTRIETLEPGGSEFWPTPGQVSAEAGRQAGLNIEKAVALALSGQSNAIVTAPISKQALNLAGYSYKGHTEFLAERTGAGNVVMMLLSGDFRVALATTHCPLSEVAAQLNRDMLVNKLKVLFQDLKIRFGLQRPQIGVAALNPHAGEGGLLGTEESDVILPAIEFSRSAGIDVFGPFPADTLFARHSVQPYDAYLAMYHDQGLIPLKLKAFGSAVNYTVGLPVIRTSPDHGTAFDIAGSGRADETSMKEALRLAIELAS